MTYQIIFRECSYKDLDEIFQIEKEAFGGDSYSMRILEYLLNNADVFLVAEADEQVVGYICGEYLFKRGHIISLAIKRGYRGRGIGKELLNMFVRSAVIRGIEEVYLEVSIENVDAINFYRKMGFKVSGNIKGYYRGGVDAYIMTKKISRLMNLYGSIS
jgi:ribosomal-protein-alanine N-acetyltransferase